MSPKSLLRHPLCVSPIEAFQNINDNSFYEYYDDPDVGPRGGKKIRKALFCTGKVYYDLLQHKTANNIKDVAIIRIEQLYPFPKKHLDGLLKKYKSAKICWVQEEPANMGAWQFIFSTYPSAGFDLISRKHSASPATGFKKVHDKNQLEIVKKAFK